MPLRNVNPGDLITALDWNGLIAMVNALDGRVTELEGSSEPGEPRDPRITQVLPTGTVTAGDTITIFGSNFDFVIGGHSVFFGSTRAISFLEGSQDTILIVEIPDPVAGATPTGTPMTLTVGNLVNTTSTPITVRSRPVVTAGGFQFSFQGSRPETPVQNTTILYDLQLRSFASEDLVVTITPTIHIITPVPAGVTVTEAQLAALLRVVEDGIERANRQIQLPEGITKTISLQLNLPNQTDQLRYSLSATASAPGVTSVVESLPNQQVGHASEQPDATITNFDFFSLPAGSTFSTSAPSGLDGTLNIPRGTTVTLRQRAQFAGLPSGQTHHYDFTVSFDGPANSWSAVRRSTMQNPVQVLGPGGLRDIFTDITAPSSATTAVLRLLLTHEEESGVNNHRGVLYRLQTI